MIQRNNGKGSSGSEMDVDASIPNSPLRANDALALVTVPSTRILLHVRPALPLFPEEEHSRLVRERVQTREIFEKELDVYYAQVDTRQASQNHEAESLSTTEGIQSKLSNEILSVCKEAALKSEIHKVSKKVTIVNGEGDTLITYGVQVAEETSQRPKA
ncbi:hypothetical protein AMTR_s00046p00207820 [Amborella trichopoda]|nr:hypothetical protein AMTR_s00046p00207820 [Amborella trichopoda]